MQGASVLTLYAILIVAVVQDITSMRISNRLIIMGLFLSMAFGIVLGGMPRIIQVLLNISKMCIRDRAVVSVDLPSHLSFFSLFCA